jgi:predicted secreted protein
VSDIRIGTENAGRTVEVAAGDRVVIALPEIGGTGYTWQVEELPSGGKLVDEHYEQTSTGIGGMSQHVFVIEPGEGGRLRLKQGRPWLDEEGVIDRYDVTVNRAAQGR